jgi:hypothetical protein
VLKLLPCELEVMGSSPASYRNAGKAVCMRPKVVGPFPRPCTSGSLLQEPLGFLIRVPFFFCVMLLAVLTLKASSVCIL